MSRNRGDDDVFRTRKVVQGYTEDDLNLAAKHLAKAARLIDIVRSGDEKTMLDEIDAAIAIIKKCVRRRKGGQS